MRELKVRGDYGACLSPRPSEALGEELGFELPSLLKDPIMAVYQQSLCDLRLGELKRDSYVNQGSHSLLSEVPFSSEALCTALMA